MVAVRRIATQFDLLSHWSGRPDFLDCEREYGRLAVAVNGTADLIAFGGALRRGGVTHLADLFVDRRYQSAGVGRALLDEVLDGAAARVTFASADPRAVPLYLRYGLVPRCPMYYLSGPAVSGPTPVDIVDVEAVVPLDAAASGGERGDVLRWYAGLPGVQVYGGPDGYAFTRDRDGEVLVGPAAGTETVLGAAACRPGRTLRLTLFGTHPLLPRLLAAGLRIGDTDTFLASDGELVPLNRYVPNPDLG
jgi:GNAT superfamily N-acetyltransferase